MAWHWRNLPAAASSLSRHGAHTTWPTWHWKMGDFSEKKQTPQSRASASSTVTSDSVDDSGYPIAITGTSGCALPPSQRASYGDSAWKVKRQLSLQEN
jgi:hypothetical protein